MKEEYFIAIIEKTIRGYVFALLRSDDFSRRYHDREDAKDIDKEVEKLSREISKRFVKELDQKGYLEEGKELSEEEFRLILDSIIEKYMADTYESKDGP